MACYQLSGIDLTQIEGINVLNAQAILSETGTDMSKWPTVKHFTSWLGLCPNNQITGGKVMHRQTQKNNNRAARALKLAAQGISTSKGALGGYYRRQRARLGPAQAITANAHKLARIIYAMLKNRTSYCEPASGYYEEQARLRAVKNLKRKANQLGFHLVAQAASISFSINKIGVKSNCPKHFSTLSLEQCCLRNAVLFHTVAKLRGLRLAHMHLD